MRTWKAITQARIAETRGGKLDLEQRMTVDVAGESINHDEPRLWSVAKHHRGQIHFQIGMILVGSHWSPAENMTLVMLSKVSIKAAASMIAGAAFENGATNMKTTRLAAFLLFAALALVVSVTVVGAQTTPTPTPNPKLEKEKAKVRKMAQDTLQRLYKSQPLAKKAVEGAAGYAVFSDVGVKLGIAGSGRGQGIAVKNKGKEETFMKMLEVQAGLGLGVKKFKVIFVFDNEKAFNNFVESCWQFGGQSTVAAKTGDKGGSLAGAASVSNGVWMYQLTDKGLALEITAKSTKYYKDDDLNK